MSGHQVETAKDRGWEGLNNGDLLEEAEKGNYEVFVTSDQSIRYQQNLARRRIAILLLTDNLWPNVRQKAAEVQSTIDGMKPGEYQELEI